MITNTDKKESICVLLSCMYQDISIVERTNIQTNVVVVNQCDEEKRIEKDFLNKLGEKCHLLFICTKERGLSRSRNMAIHNCTSDICLICDDDEVFEDDYEQTVLAAYAEYPNAGLITFNYKIVGKEKEESSKKSSRFTFKDIFKTASIQISFRRKYVEKFRISFDEKMGSGTGNGGGEENKFLYCFYKKRIKMNHFPVLIVNLKPSDSHSWFPGYTKEFFRNWGWATGRIFGKFIGSLYILYVTITHYSVYKKKEPSATLLGTIKEMFKGLLENR